MVKINKMEKPKKLTENDFITRPTFETIGDVKKEEKRMG